MTDLQTIRALALAAKGWLEKAEVLQDTEDDVCQIGAYGEDGEFYELIDIDCENYGFPSRPLAEYIIAACNALPAILDKLEASEPVALVHECELDYINKHGGRSGEILNFKNNPDLADDPEFIHLYAAPQAAQPSDEERWGIKCENCGENYGSHVGVRCPNTDSNFKAPVPKRVGTIGHIGHGKTTLTAAIATSLAQQPPAQVNRDALDAKLGRVALRFVDRAGDVHPGIDDAETICAEFYAAMCKAIDKNRTIAAAEGKQ